MTSPVDPRKLFRTAALNKHLMGDSTDELLVIPPAHIRFSITYLLILLMIGVLWLLLGALTVEVKGKGIFMNTGGVYVIEAQTTGFISEIPVRTGDAVNQGDLLARIYDAKQDIALNSAEIILSQLERNYEELKKQITLEEEKTKKAIQEQIEANKNKVEKIEKTIPSLEEDYQKKKKLFPEGLVSNTAVLESEKILSQRKTSLETTKSTIATLEANLKKSYRAEELRVMEERILEAREKRDLLVLNMKFIQIYSPLDAQVLEVLVPQGEIVIPGKKIVALESRGGPEATVVYGIVNAEVSKRISAGLQILVDPANINSQEFGSLVAEVMEISPHPMSNEEIATIVHSTGLISYLTAGTENSAHLVTIKPFLDPTTPSGFKWTSGKGPPVLIPTGTVCNLTGIGYYERPIVRFLPIWRVTQAWNNLKRYFHDWIDETPHEGLKK